MSAMKHHVRNPFQLLTNRSAIEISESRQYRDTGSSGFRRGQRKNTVFAKPYQYLWCTTDDPEFGNLIISQHPVRTIHCEKANSSSVWTSKEIGTYHSIFDSKTGDFPGYLYKKVVFVNFPFMNEMLDFQFKNRK
jgi:hypothetical protein